MSDIVGLEVVGLREIGQVLGVSSSRVSQLARAYDDFPEPIGTPSSGRVWRRADIEAWVARHPDRKPGRRPRGD